MREDINFDELIDKIDFILNSSKPLPHYMKEEREWAVMLTDQMILEKQL